MEDSDHKYSNNSIENSVKDIYNKNQDKKDDTDTFKSNILNDNQSIQRQKGDDNRNDFIENSLKFTKKFL